MSECPNVLLDPVVRFLHACSGLLLYSLHGSIQRPWDVGNLLIENQRFPLELSMKLTSPESSWWAWKKVLRLLKTQSDTKQALRDPTGSRCYQ